MEMYSVKRTEKESNYKMKLLYILKKENNVRNKPNKMRLHINKYI